MKKIIIYLPLLLLFISCAATVNYIPIAKTTYPPTDKVDLYEERPTQKFVEIGLIIVSSEGSESIIKKKAKKKAMEIGADAIVIIDKSEDVDRWRVDTQHRLPSAQTYIKFLAIRFVKEGDE